MDSVLIIFVLLAVLIIAVVLKSIALVPQGEAAVIERLGRYTRTVSGGLTIMVPFVDRIRAKVDIREQVVSFPPQAVITKDNLTVAIDTVVTFQINDAAAAIYGVNNYLVGVEQVSTATLRDVVGGMMLEDTLTSRETINQRLRGELDNATTNWGLRIARVELKAIDPPPSIQQSMELQMRAEREKRAMILTAEGKRESEIRTAEGQKQSNILTAEGEKHARILRAEAERQAEILRAEGSRAARHIEAQGEAKAIMKVNAAIRAAQVTPEVLAYQYLEKLPKLAEGSANKTWMIPMQFGDALQQFANSMSKPDEDGVFRFEPSPVDDETIRIATEDKEEEWTNTDSNSEIAEAVAAANAEASRSVDDAVPPMNSTGASATSLGQSAAKHAQAYEQQGSSPLAQPANQQQQDADS